MEGDPDVHRARAREGMAHISTLLTAAGLTSVHDAGASRDKLVAYQDAYRAGELRHRAYIMVRGPYEDLRNAGVYTGFGDEWVRIGGVKYAADGSASERTMRMSTPFEGKPDDYGILTMSQEEIHEGLADRRRREDGPSAVTGSVFVTWRVPPAPSGPSPPAFRRPRRRAPRGTTARALRHAPRGGPTRARAAAGT